MTMTEKILARHSDNTSVAPGQNIWTNVDKLMTHDVCGPGTFGIFQREFGENAQVLEPRIARCCMGLRMCMHAAGG
jgi:3-isopropylmalate/(R)-2-methylmalate dehydratase large subunit